MKNTVGKVLVIVAFVLASLLSSIGQTQAKDTSAPLDRPVLEDRMYAGDGSKTVIVRVQNENSRPAVEWWFYPPLDCSQDTTLNGWKIYYGYTVSVFWPAGSVEPTIEIVKTQSRK